MGQEHMDKLQVHLSGSQSTENNRSGIPADVVCSKIDEMKIKVLRMGLRRIFGLLKERKSGNAGRTGT